MFAFEQNCIRTRFLFCQDKKINETFPKMYMYKYVYFPINIWEIACFLTKLQ